MMTCMTYLFVWIWLYLLLSPGQTDARYKIQCPSHFPCACTEMSFGGNVTELFINCHGLSLRTVPELPVAFYDKTLTSVVLASNMIEELPANLFAGLELNIHEIRFDSNPLHKIDPAAFAAIKSVTRISLRNCQLKDVPPIFKHANGLASLILGENLLTHTRGAFAGSGLTTLDLSSNPLRLANDAFEGTEHSLQKLVLDHLKLDEIPVLAIKPLYNLRKLSLMFNNFNTVSRHTIEQLPESINFLSLMGNNITTIEPRAFDRLASRRHKFYLGLGFNKIRSLDFIQSPCLYRNSEITLYDNPFVCDCNLYNLTKYKLVRIIGECMYPQQYVGYDVYHEPTFEGRVSFTETTPPMCNDTEPHMRYDCDCDLWVDSKSEIVCSGVEEYRTSSLWLLSVVSVGFLMHR